jgi:HSP20 family protein
MTKKKRKKKEFRFFWEEPVDIAEKGIRKMREKAEGFFEEPFEFRFTFPRVSMSDIRMRTIPINIGETDKEIVVRAELPGFKKNEINLNVTENAVEISAAKKEERIEKTEKSFRRELSAGAVRRAFTLPENVDPDKIEAKLEDGLLTVIVPKLYPEKKKKKRIEIS